jgi:crotonobetaine/carnitine-CoA ligase
MKAGGIFVPINTELRGKFLSHQFTNSSPKIVIINNSLVEFFENVDSLDYQSLGVIFTDIIPKEIPAALQSENHFIFDEATLDNVNGSSVELIADPPIDQICSIMYTSGTTGPSKGVLLTHGHFFFFRHHKCSEKFFEYRRFLLYLHATFSCKRFKYAMSRFYVCRNLNLLCGAF